MTVSQIDGIELGSINQVTSVRAEQAAVVETPFKLSVTLPADGIMIDKTLKDNQPRLGDNGLVTATLTLQNNSEGVTCQELSVRDVFVGGVVPPSLEITVLDPENVTFWGVRRIP